MKTLVTGLNGTVAPVLARALRAAGHDVAAWDRARVSIEDSTAIRGFIARERPDAFCHLAAGSPAWAEESARTCAELGIRFLYTSSVSVFSAAQAGPFPVTAVPEPDDDYGRYKLDCERRVRAAHPEARVARLGWQIGTDFTGNHMGAHLERVAREQGRIEASTRWFPACSFLEDTARSLLQILWELPAGLYQVDGNPGLDFHAIASGLSRFHGHRWPVVPVAGLVQNHRMLDDRVATGSIVARLAAAPAQ